MPALALLWVVSLLFHGFETSYCKRNRVAGSLCIIPILFCVELRGMLLNTSLAPFVFENFLFFLPYCLCLLIWLGQTVRWRLERSFNLRSRPVKLLKLYTPPWNWGESCTCAAESLPAKHVAAWPFCGTSVLPSYSLWSFFLLLASSLLFLLFAALQQIKSPWLFPTAEGHMDPALFQITGSGTAWLGTLRVFPDPGMSPVFPFTQEYSWLLGCFHSSCCMQ